MTFIPIKGHPSIFQAVEIQAVTLSDCCLKVYVKAKEAPFTYGYPTREQAIDAYESIGAHLLAAISQAT